MSGRENFEIYSFEQKIEEYKLLSDTNYSYRISDCDNKLVSCCQVIGSCLKEPVLFKPYFSSNEIQFKMEAEVKLFSKTFHLFCTAQNDFFAPLLDAIKYSRSAKQTEIINRNKYPMA